MKFLDVYLKSTNVLLVMDIMKYFVCSWLQVQEELYGFKDF